MKKTLEKAYNAASVEDKLYARWEKSGFFNPDNLSKDKKRKPFTIIMPPPNATGTLHIGHAVMLALEDLMIRYHRMKGDAALWIPGTDHAAIATNAKVERLLAKEGKTKYDLGREGFLKRVKEFVKNSQGTIRRQVRKMGSSCDWSRECYTLDEPRSRAVRQMFVDLYNNGLIYRGYRIVNWCPRCASTLADDEIEYKEENAKLYYIKYGPFVLATARPETKFGDTAVACHPSDARYKDWVGKEIEIDDVLGKASVKVIADSAVDPKFCTVLIKVTPAHDAVDFAIGERHGLEVRKVINEDGRLNERAGKFAGLTVARARLRVVEALKEKGLLAKEEPYKHNLSVCYRCETPVEPLPSLQWFVDVDRSIEGLGSRVQGLGRKDGKSLKQMALEVVKNGQIKIVPERFTKIYFHWMENLRDWCISRQIWWGHRIPVWYCEHCLKEHEHSSGKRKDERGNNKFSDEWGEAPASHLAGTEHIGVIVSVEEPKKCITCGNGNLKQDPDTLDTWFSSGLWSFSTLGWPRTCKETRDKRQETSMCLKIGDLKRFHPTDVLETGYDILFFWIARMILMTTYALNEIPFKTVYLHGLVRDEKGRKMSKSLGNVIDPLDVAAKYGTDAVRLALLVGTAPGADTKVWDEKIAGFRNFTNKLWNISRFILGAAEKKLTKKFYVSPVVELRQAQLTTGQAGFKFQAKTLADEWILTRLAETAKEVTQKIEAYEFSAAGEILREFTWGELADWYLEISKWQMASGKTLATNTQKILLFVLQNILKLWHPFMPFVTEAVYSRAFARGMKDFLMIAPWPALKQPKNASRIKKDFSQIQGIVRAIRNIRSDYKVDVGARLDAILYAGAKAAFLKKNSDVLTHLAKLGRLTIQKKGVRLAQAESAVHEKFEIFVRLAELQNVEKERLRLAEEIEKNKAYLEALAAKLANNNFVKRAPASVVEAERAKHKTQKEKVVKLEEQLEALA